MSGFQPIARDHLETLVDELLARDPAPELGDYWNAPQDGMVRGPRLIGVSWDLTEDPATVYLCVDDNEARITPALARSLAVALLHRAALVDSTNARAADDDEAPA